MKFYYYEFESCVGRPFFDETYDLYQGFLIDSPLGIIQFFDESENNIWSSIEEFVQWVNERFPRNFDIIELRGKL